MRISDNNYYTAGSFNTRRQEGVNRLVRENLVCFAPPAYRNQTLAARECNRRVENSERHKEKGLVADTGLRWGEAGGDLRKSVRMQR